MNLESDIKDTPNPYLGRHESLLEFRLIHFRHPGLSLAPARSAGRFTPLVALMTPEATLGTRMTTMRPKSVV